MWDDCYQIAEQTQDMFYFNFKIEKSYTRVARAMEYWTEMDDLGREKPFFDHEGGHVAL